jgi:uncharacterized membrane protein
MPKEPQKPVVCQICRQPKKMADVLPAEFVRESVVESIRKRHPDWSSEGYICFADLNRFITQHVQDVLEQERGALSALEQQVVQSLQDQEVLAEDVNKELDRRRTLGDRVADRVAVFGGSWKFITSFGIVLVVWVVINSLLAFWRPFDPYPFILLNLVLSCLAAIQAPVILMSQNRQASKDRLRSEHDYGVNLKAELEIRHLHQKLDLLLKEQWRHLLDIQQMQTDLMQEIIQRRPSGPRGT